MGFFKGNKTLTLQNKNLQITYQEYIRNDTETWILNFKIKNLTLWNTCDRRGIEDCIKWEILIH